MRQTLYAHRSNVSTVWLNIRVRVGRKGLRAIGLLLALIMAALPNMAAAQTPPNLRIPPVTLPEPDQPLGEDEDLPALDAPELQISALRNVIVDTDPGVDDAAALIWLLSQQRYPINPLGIVTVAGNTSVENATNNVLLLLDWLEITDVPVVIGASKPSRRLLSKVGMPIHGPDGLWFLGTQYDQSGLAKNAPQFYCDTVAAQPEPLIIALGPLTNLSDAINRCKHSWQGVEIVSLGGAKFGGNQTPVTEYNYWQDPEAADFVLANGPKYGYTVTMMPYDAFQQFTVRSQDRKLLAVEGIPAIKNLLPALTLYAQSLTRTGAPLTLPDVAAAIYALDNRAGDAQSALVKVLSHPAVPGYARGQTVVGLFENEKITMIASDEQLNALAELAIFGSEEEFYGLFLSILESEPDNATFVTKIRQVPMYVGFIEDLTGGSAADDGAIEGAGVGANDDTYRLFVPMVE